MRRTCYVAYPLPAARRDLQTSTLHQVNGENEITVLYWPAAFHFPSLSPERNIVATCVERRRQAGGTGLANGMRLLVLHVSRGGQGGPGPLNGKILVYEIFNCVQFCANVQ